MLDPKCVNGVDVFRSARTSRVSCVTRRDAGRRAVRSKSVWLPSTGKSTFSILLHLSQSDTPTTFVTSEAPELNAEAVQKVAVKSVNDSTGSDGLLPTLLVYSALPGLGSPRDKPHRH